MRQLLLTICFSALFFSTIFHAQTGCPGCVVNVPASFPADTIYLPDLPDGVKGTPYNEDVSFRLPKTTTPVNAIDSTTPPGLTITKFEILAIDGLPPGLYWQLNQSVFDPATQTDGCIKICGTPLETDSFELTVTLKATVFILTQESTFPMSLYIAPKVSTTDGFSITNPIGCGSTTVTLTNNVPSNGDAGFSYLWDFGDGSPLSAEENPAPHIYPPGVYEIGYQAIVDTAGYILESIKLTDVACTDPPLYGNPDLFIEIRTPNDSILYNSSPAINNTSIPYTFPINVLLGPGNYTLIVWDDDGGIKGTDDGCGNLSFNILSDGTLVAGGLTVEMNILHPVDTIYSRDTVIVYPQPIAPTVNAPNGLTVCQGATDLVLSSSYGFGNQWILNGNLIQGATDFIYMPTENGAYQVQYISQDGCVATSDSAEVTIHPLPAEPTWFNYNNSLRLANPANLPAQYSLQWYNAGVPIPGETGIWYCSLESGTYSLVVTDLETGCTNSFGAQITHNPNFDCLVGTQSPDIQTFEILPNPTAGSVLLRLHEPLQTSGSIRVWDASGRLVHTLQVHAGMNTLSLEIGHLNAGVYAVEILTEGFHGLGRVVRM
ncbi:MAG: T9SS type A sorting domain-containing protein [Lewinellaceae bacterium]|nr:T9SS type A sorting domain-containing protein [Lewinellaceae bacterium]